jgi:hypothetical protein
MDSAKSGGEVKTMFTGAGGVVAVVVIIIVCAVVFTIAIRKEMN